MLYLKKLIPDTEKLEDFRVILGQYFRPLSIVVNSREYYLELDIDTHKLLFNCTDKYRARFAKKFLTKFYDLYRKSLKKNMHCSCEGGSFVEYDLIKRKIYINGKEFNSLRILSKTMENFINKKPIRKR